MEGGKGFTDAKKTYKIRKRKSYSDYDKTTKNVRRAFTETVEIRVDKLHRDVCRKDATELNGGCE